MTGLVHENEMVEGKCEAHSSFQGQPPHPTMPAILMQIPDTSSIDTHASAARNESNATVSLDGKNGAEFARTPATAPPSQDPRRSRPIMMRRIGPRDSAPLELDALQMVDCSVTVEPLDPAVPPVSLPLHRSRKRLLPRDMSSRGTGENRQGKRVRSLGEVCMRQARTPQCLTGLPYLYLCSLPTTAALVVVLEGAASFSPTEWNLT